MTSYKFRYPIGIQLFNRPEYAREMLKSFKVQSCQVDQTKMFIFIDGYQGSHYECYGNEDKTREVELVARELFPKAQIVAFDQNLGIAELHNKLQKASFAGLSKWAAFFEEDVVLKENHLEELSKLISIVNGSQKVVKVSCFQVLPSLSNLPRGYDGFYPGRGTQAFAERRSFFLRKQKTLDVFFEITKSKSTSTNKFKDAELSAELALYGHNLPYLQHDSLVESILIKDGLLHVTSMPDLAIDIGLIGVHSYTTAPIHSDVLSSDNFRTIEERAVEYQKSLDIIHKEFREHVLSLYRDIFEAFHMSRSRKSMLKKIFWMYVRKWQLILRK